MGAWGHNRNTWSVRLGMLWYTTRTRVIQRLKKEHSDNFTFTIRKVSCGMRVIHKFWTPTANSGGHSVVPNWTTVASFIFHYTRTVVHLSFSPSHMLEYSLSMICSSCVVDTKCIYSFTIFKVCRKAMKLVGTLWQEWIFPM